MLVTPAPNSNPLTIFLESMSWSPPRKKRPMLNLNSKVLPHNLKIEIFTQRCEARALLWVGGELTLHDAVDVLQRWAEDSGLIQAIGQDRVQHIIAVAFEQRRIRL